MGDMSRYVDRAMDSKFITRKIANETVIVPVTSEAADLDSVYTLNDVASFVWQLLEKRQSANAIAAAVAAEYDVSMEQAALDVDELLTDLESKGLVQSSPRPGSDS